ncbi:hypothetical protein AAULR_20487 [Lacticaseibacillus rhamnosus MTCC 5462]|nr:hypothetical protein AAULR_20487 [Lacticaseibacillus rhamnosus MTCC 5462]
MVRDEWPRIRTTGLIMQTGSRLQEIHGYPSIREQHSRFWCV